MSISFSTRVRATDAHLTALAAGEYNIRTEFADLIADLKLAYDDVELQAAWPRVNWIDGGYAAAAGGDIELNGENLLQSMTFDSLEVREGAADLTLYALKPGNSLITMTMTVGAGALSVAYSHATRLLEIELAAGGSTDDAVATAINANAADTDGYIRATSGGGGSFTAGQANTALASGTGDYENTWVKLTGVECLPKNEAGAGPTSAKWSDTQIMVTVPDLTAETDARAASDTALMEVCVNGTRCPTLCGPLA